MHVVLVLSRRPSFQTEEATVRRETGEEELLDGVDVYGPFADPAKARRLAQLAKRDGHVSLVRELVPPACNESYPDDRFGVWCRCKLPLSHPGEHAYTHDGRRGTVTIDW